MKSRAILKIVGAAAGFELFQEFHGWNEAVPSASAQKRIAQLLAEGLNADGIQAHQADIAQRGGELARIVKLRDGAGGHGVAAIEQDADGNTRLHLEHFQKQLFQAQVGAPVDRAQIVAMVELAVIEKLLAGSGEMRDIVAAHQARERFLPADGQPLELLKERAVDQWLGFQWTAFT